MSSDSRAIFESITCVVFTCSCRSGGMDTAGVDVRGVEIDAAGVCTGSGTGVEGNKSGCTARVVVSSGAADVARTLGAGTGAGGAGEVSGGVIECGAFSSTGGGGQWG